MRQDIREFRREILSQAEKLELDLLELLGDPIRVQIYRKHRNDGLDAYAAYLMLERQEEGSA